MDYSSNYIIFLRRIIRKTRLHLLIYKYLRRGRYEKNVKKVIKDNIKNGDIVWDVGSNIGLYTSLFSKLVKENGRIYSFEPHPTTFSILKKKNLRNTTYLNFGLSNKKKNDYFTNYHDKKNVINSVVNKAQYSGQTIKVKINTGDNIVKKKIAKIPNFLKIDVEGYELFVIKGMKNVLLNKNVKYIIIEVHHKALDQLRIKDGVKKIVKLLSKNNFKIKWISPSHIFANKF
jgi:FkbM family methyltransferase